MNAHELDHLITPWTDHHDGASMKSHELILQILRCSDNPFSRHQYAPGHITGTGLVTHPNVEAFLVVHHKRLNRWLLPGGHVENVDTSIFDAARREVLEETSVALSDVVAPRLIGFDVHGIPSNGREPFHLHHDIVVAFQASDETIAVSEESRAVEWCRLDELDVYQIPDNIRRCLKRL